MLLDQVAQRAGPGRRGVPAAGGGLERPPPLGGLLPRRLQGGQGGGQVPGREGLPGLVGGLGDGQDAPGRLGGDGRVRLGAGFRLLVPGGAASGGRGGLAGVGRAAGGPGGGCPAPVVLPVPGASAGGASPPGAAVGAAGVQVSAMPGLLPLTRVAVPAFSCAIRACRAAAVLIPAWAAITATAAPAGSADSAARTAAAGLSPAAGATGAGAGSVAASAALRAACGAGVLVRAMVVTPFLFSGAIPVFDLPAPVFSGRQLLWSGREVKRLRENSRYRFPPMPGGARKYTASAVLTWHDISRSDLAGSFPEAAGPHSLLSVPGAASFPRPAFSFPRRLSRCRDPVRA